MPHIDLGNDSFIDLELEFHTSDKDSEFLKYIKALLKGEEIQSHHYGMVQLPDLSTHALAQYIVKDNMIKILVSKHFSDATYDKLIDLAKRYI